jgi:hypothetical protein
MSEGGILSRTDKIEARLNATAISGTEIQMGFGGVSFSTMMEVMEFAKLMSLSGAAVPYHLRGNPGACLAICTRALRFNFDPFALAEHSFIMMKRIKTTATNEHGGRSTREDEVETICYDSYVIRAIIEAHAPIEGRLKYDYVGAGRRDDLQSVGRLPRDRRAYLGRGVTHTRPTQNSHRQERVRQFEGLAAVGVEAEATAWI